MSVIKKLGKLSREEPDYSDFSQFHKETKRLKNDRGTAILLAANIENTLDAVLSRALADSKQEELFDFRGPLGTFSAKILMAHALELIGPVTFHNLTHIRHIRNAFAHSKKPITFRTPEVAAACALLQMQYVLPPRTVPKAGEKPERFIGRRRYQRVCEVVNHNLIVHSLRLIDRKGIARQALKDNISIDPGLELRLHPTPLP
jgi:DNA-binding MltR family transcriptional regulator